MSEGEVEERQLRRRAEALLELNRPEEAAAVAAQLVASTPNDARVWSLFARCQSRCEQPREALASIERALALAPDSAAYHLRRGELLAALKRYDKAIEDGHAALELDAHNAEAYAWLGAMYATRGRRRIGQQYWKSDDLLAADEYAAQAMEMDPNSELVRLNAAFVALRCGQKEYAVHLYRSILATNPTHARAHYMVSTISLGRSDVRNMTAGVAALLRIHPQFKPARTLLTANFFCRLVSWHLLGWLAYLAVADAVLATRPSTALSRTMVGVLHLLVAVGSVLALPLLGVLSCSWDRSSAARALARSMLRSSRGVHVVLASDVVMAVLLVLGSVGLRLGSLNVIAIGLAGIPCSVGALCLRRLASRK